MMQELISEIRKTYENEKSICMPNIKTEREWDSSKYPNLSPMFLFRKVVKDFGLIPGDADKYHILCYPNLYPNRNYVPGFNPKKLLMDELEECQKENELNYYGGRA